MSTIDTGCFNALFIRKAIEHNVFCIYENDGVTLKPYTEWPGHYWLASSSQRIPAIYTVGAQQVPSNYNPVGIECTIYDVPDATKLPSRGVRATRDRWRVRFTNYGFDEAVSVNSSLLEISRRMTAVFQTIEQVYTERNEVSYEGLICYVSITTLNPVFVSA